MDLAVLKLARRILIGDDQKLTFDSEWVFYDLCQYWLPFVREH
jgi:hypothetical protein